MRMIGKLRHADITSEANAFVAIRNGLRETASNFIPGAFPGTIRICCDQAKVRAPCWPLPYARLAQAR